MNAYEHLKISQIIPTVGLYQRFRSFIKGNYKDITLDELEAFEKEVERKHSQLLAAIKTAKKKVTQS